MNIFLILCYRTEFKGFYSEKQRKQEGGPPSKMRNELVKLNLVLKTVFYKALYFAGGPAYIWRPVFMNKTKS
jgi:hypothetical protein